MEMFSYACFVLSGLVQPFLCYSNQSGAEAVKNKMWSVLSARQKLSTMEIIIIIIKTTLYM